MTSLSLGRVDGTWLENLALREDINTLVTAPCLRVELDRGALKRFAI